VAAEKGQVKAASLLIDHGMDPLAKFDGKHNAVYLSVIHGQMEFVRWFLDRYADRLDRRLKTDLVTAAAGCNRINILEMFDKKGFPMTDVDENGISALSIALHFKHNDAIVYMLRRGADPDSHIPTDPNSWVLKDPTRKEGLDLLRSAKRQREMQPDGKLFPEWRYNDEL
jgi:ankyrin repeat protein